jgi:hypothetical protein
MSFVHTTRSMSAMCKTNMTPFLMHRMRILINDAQAEIVENLKKKCGKLLKSWEKSAMKLSQIRRRIELCMREIHLTCNLTTSIQVAVA